MELGVGGSRGDLARSPPTRHVFCTTQPEQGHRQKQTPSGLRCGVLHTAARTIGGMEGFNLNLASTPHAVRHTRTTLPVQLAKASLGVAEYVTCRMRGW